MALFQRETGNSPIRTGLMGTILGCAVYVSSNARSYAAGAASSKTAYSALFLGRESFGIAGIGNTLPDIPTGDSGGERSNNTGKGVKPVELIVKDLGETGLDPLNQRGTIGWKATYDGKILNSSWIYDLEHVTIYS